MKNNRKGQALVEYVLIIALVALVIIGVISTFGGVLKDKIIIKMTIRKSK